MKVRFNRTTKELTFLDGTTTLNSNDVLWHTLEVEMEGGALLPNEHLFVAFSKVDGSISTQGELLPKQEAYHIPQEVFASAGEWKLEILIRVYDAVSGSYIQRGASNKGSFSVEEGLHFNGESNPVTINSLGGVKTDLSIAQEDISKLSEELETIPLIVNTSVLFSYSFLQVLRVFNGSWNLEVDGEFDIGQIVLPFEAFNRKPLIGDEFWLDFETNDGYKVKILARVNDYYEEADEQIVWFFAGELDLSAYENGGEGVWNDKLIIIRNGATQTDIENIISELVTKQSQFAIYKVVDKLPVGIPDDVNKIYLVPATTQEEDNILEEWLYIVGKGWELVGTQKAGISGFNPDEYVKFTDYATESKAGAVKVAHHRGIAINVGTGLIELHPASETELKNRAWYKPITGGNLDTALKVGVTTNTLPLTDEEMASACDWIGAVPKWKPVADGSTSFIGLRADGNFYVYNLTFGVPRNNAIPCYTARGAGNNVIATGTPELDTDCTNKKYVDDLVGDIEAVLDSVIALQNSLIGGNS